MECPWVARARAPCVAEDEDQITLAKGDRVRVERHCPESQTAFVAFSCAAGIIRGLVPLSLLEPVDAEEGASEGEPSQGGVDDELDMFRAQLGHGELQTTRAADSDDEVDDDFEELIKDVEDAREDAVAVEQTPSRAAASDASGGDERGRGWSRPPFWLMERIALVCDGDPSGLAWCATCKHARSSRPPLRVLAIGDFWEGTSVGPAATFPKAADLFCVRLSAWSGALADETLARVSATHAAEVTHLFVKVSHCAGGAATESGPSDTRPPEPDAGAGASSGGWAHQRAAAAAPRPSDAGLAKFSSLRALHIQHLSSYDRRAGGSTSRLIEAAKGTLRTLCVESKHWLHEEAIPALQSLGRLEHLALVLLPNTTRVIFESGSPAATAALQRAAAAACPSLVSHARICCHRPALTGAEVTGWYRSIRPDAKWYAAAFAVRRAA